MLLIYQAKLPAKQEGKYTITKSPQSYREREEKEGKKRKTAAIPISFVWLTFVTTALSLLLLF